MYASPPVAEVEADVDRLDNVDRGWVDIRRLLAIDADTALAFVCARPASLIACRNNVHFTLNKLLHFKIPTFDKLE